MPHLVKTLMLVALLAGVASEVNETPLATRKSRPKRAARPSQAEVLSPSAVGTGITFKVKRQPPTATSTDKASGMGDDALQRSHISRTLNAVLTTVEGISEPKRIFSHAGRLMKRHEKHPDCMLLKYK